MPFKSKSQMRACFAKKDKNKAKGWDCHEWADHTNFKKLPEKASEFGALLGKIAAEKAACPCNKSKAKGKPRKKR